jgi:hypothetical protein
VQRRNKGLFDAVSNGAVMKAGPCLTALIAPAVLAVSLWCAQSAGASVISNSGFEAEKDGVTPLGLPTVNPEYLMPEDWSWRMQGIMNGHGVHKNNPVIGWSSEGNWSLCVFAAVLKDNPIGHFTGNYVEFYQPVDLTGITSIVFDAMLEQAAYTQSYVAIDSVPVWLRNTPGTYLGEQIDTSMFSGVHEIALGVKVLSDFGPVVDGLTHFDNLIDVPVPEPGTLSLLVLGAGLFVRFRKQPR